MSGSKERQKCSNCVAVKKLDRYTATQAGKTWEVVTLFCQTWGCYVHEHDAEKCVSFIKNLQ